MSALLKRAAVFRTLQLGATRGSTYGRIGPAASQRLKSTTTTASKEHKPLPSVALPLATTTQVSADGQTHITTLPNGLRIVSERNPGHFTAVGVYVDAGSRYEDSATSGYAHLMDRLAFRSSERFTSAESMAMIEKLGGSIMSSSSRECIMYQAAVFPHDVPIALKLLADTTLRPKILPEEVEELRLAVPWELQEV
ncbi:Mitochondrial-processing peptidase subunit alpha, partial [Coemansia sp. RSA 1694]